MSSLGLKPNVVKTARLFLIKVLNRQSQKFRRFVLKSEEKRFLLVIKLPRVTFVILARLCLSGNFLLRRPLRRTVRGRRRFRLVPSVLRLFKLLLMVKLMIL